MHSIFDVAKYILNIKGSMATMKLQKLCYYAQAWSLAWDDKPLFKEDFQAWANGPVCPELFFAHKGKFELPRDYFDDRGDSSAFDSDEIETLDIVLDSYGDKGSQWLSELTHQEKPWRAARAGVAPGERCNTIIEKEDMQEYYGGLE